LRILRFARDDTGRGNAAWISPAAARLHGDIQKTLISAEEPRSGGRISS
jgi:hypothetical protein